MFLVGLLFFTAASLLCGLAWSAEALIGARALQGVGAGLAFVTASIAALAGVADREAGLASGLSNTSFQVGAALGTAIVSTVAVSTTEDFVASHTAADRLVALTEGFQAGFVASAVFPVLGLIVSLALLGRPRRAREDELEPASAFSAPD